MNITPIPKDYKPPEGGDYKTFEDGTYKVKTMKWTTSDEAKNPILVKSENKAEMYGRLQFLFEDGLEGPPMTVELYNMPLLAIAFNSQAKLPELPEETQAGKVTDYMKQIEDIVNNSDKIVEVTVKGGWVNFVKGMEIPGDKFYYWRILQVVSKNENNEPSFKRFDWPKGGHSNVVKILCEILAENMGKDSKFKSARFILSFDYGFTYDEETNQIDWRKTDNDNWTADAKRASTLYQLTAPEMFDPFEPDDLSNVVPYWIKNANFPSIPMLGFLTIKQAKSGFRYYQMDFNQIEHVDNFKTEPSQPDFASDNELDIKARNIFMEVMDFLANGKTMSVNWEPTELGIETGKKYLGPLKKTKENPTGKIIGKYYKDLTHSDVTSYLDALVESLDPDSEPHTTINWLQEKLNLFLIGLEDNVMVIEDEEIPF